MDTSSLEGPWKSLLATGPKRPHPYLYQSGYLPPGGIIPHLASPLITLWWDLTALLSFSELINILN